MPLTTHAVNLDLPTGRIEGHCHPEFEPVLETFEANFRERGEVGASVCVTVEGERVVDLWGGIANKKTQQPWTEDTLCVVHSCTKGAAALCLHMLVSRGQVDLDAPVVEYWPEYGRNGKEKTTVRMLLDHTAGVPAVREQVRPGGFYEFDYMMERIENEEPFFEPGTRSAYHGFTYAWTVGGLFRKVAGMPLGEFFRKEVAEPLGLEFWIGLPEELESRVAPTLLFKMQIGQPLTPFLQKVTQDPKSISFLFLMNSGGWSANAAECHRAEIGSANGIANARGLAGLYAPLANGGRQGKLELVDPDTLQRMKRVSSASHLDATLLIPARFGLGFMRSMDNRGRRNPTESCVMGEEAFGHVGAGGSIGFADPEPRMSFGYAMNQMGPGLLLNERGQSLVDAAYRSLGWTSSASGAWRP